jgi:hypothetical protein
MRNSAAKNVLSIRSFRIVRNKAAEKAKQSMPSHHHHHNNHHHQQQQQHQQQSSQHSNGNGTLSHAHHPISPSSPSSLIGGSGGSGSVTGGCPPGAPSTPVGYTIGSILGIPPSLAVAAAAAPAGTGGPLSSLQSAAAAAAAVAAAVGGVCPPPPIPQSIGTHHPSSSSSPISGLDRHSSGIGGGDSTCGGVGGTSTTSSAAVKRLRDEHGNGIATGEFIAACVRITLPCRFYDGKISARIFRTANRTSLSGTLRNARLLLRGSTYKFL